MGKKFNDLMAATMPPEAIAEVKERVQAMSEEMARDNLLHALEQTRQSVARELNVDSKAVAEIERCADLYLSCLRAQLQGMGGTLDITARFAGGEAAIEKFAVSRNGTSEVDPAELKAPVK